MAAQHFKTTIAKTGSRTYIEIPFDPNAVWGAKQRHHTTGSISGCKVRGSLGSEGGRFFLPLGAAWRRDNGLEAGADVEVIISPEGPQTDTISVDVSAALA